VSQKECLIKSNDEDMRVKTASQHCDTEFI